MVRPSFCVKTNVKRGPWTDEDQDEEEDVKILACGSKPGAGNSTPFPRKDALKKCGKSCRLKRTSCLRPDTNQDGFAAEEEDLIIKLHAAIGSRWTIIAQQLPGRTDIDVKNHWNSKLRKKLKYMGVDPVTHKPFSQILADYKNIEGLSSSGPRIRSIHNDLKHAFMVKTEPYSMIPFSTPSPTSTITTSSSEPMIANSSNSGYYSGNYSHDLLTQLQSITLVTEASSSNISPAPTPSPMFFTLLASAPPVSIPEQQADQDPFPWREFLMEEALQPGDQAPEIDNSTQLDISSNTFRASEIKPPSMPPTMKEAAGQVNDAAMGSLSLSESSFVEAMLDQESAMMLCDFP
ncbi:Transcription factor MYB35-like protein, partial [Drosera capensis]